MGGGGVGVTRGSSDKAYSVMAAKCNAKWAALLTCHCETRPSYRAHTAVHWVSCDVLRSVPRLNVVECKLIFVRTVTHESCSAPACTNMQI